MPPPKPPPSVPTATPLAAALERSEPLAQLRRRLADAQARFEAVRPLLPAGLADLVSAGPVDDEGWSVLARNGSAAAKLRQLRPRLEAALRERGWQVSAIRIKVQSR
jgi:hypothetical protein